MGASLIPILRTDIAAGTSCNVHLSLIAVVTVGTLPNELAVLIIDNFDLSVISAYLAVVALGIKLGVHNVVIDELHYAENCVDIVLHIRNLYIRDRAAGRELLELSLKRKLCKSVDRLGNVYVVRVCYIVSVGNTLNYAEAVLKALRELICRALKGSSVEGVVDILGSLPLCGVLVELLHYLKTKLLALTLGELLAVKRVYALPKSRVAERKS